MLPSKHTIAASTKELAEDAGRTCRRRWRARSRGFAGSRRFSLRHGQDADAAEDHRRQPPEAHEHQRSDFIFCVADPSRLFVISVMSRTPKSSGRPGLMRWGARGARPVMYSVRDGNHLGRRGPDEDLVDVRESRSLWNVGGPQRILLVARIRLIESIDRRRRRDRRVGVDRSGHRSLDVDVGPEPGPGGKNDVVLVHPHHVHAARTEDTDHLASSRSASGCRSRSATRRAE